MAKQEYKILEFHGGTNNKFDPRDIGDNQNAFGALSVRHPGRLVKEGDAKNLYSKTNINGLQIAPIDANPSTGGFTRGLGLFSFSHDYNMDSTPVEVDTDYIVINDANQIEVYDPNKDSSAGWADKFTLGSRNTTVKPEYYNVDGALRVCDSNFEVKDVNINTDLAITKNDFKIGIDNSAAILAGHVIQINQEIMYVTSGGDSGAVDEITVIRGFANTKITSHLINQDIFFVNVPKYFGHIKADRLFECETSNSVNAWTEDVQTPQPPNNTRKSDGTTGTLASSAGIQSLRVYDIIEGATANYPAESEKVVLEFGESAFDIGIVGVTRSGDTITITTKESHGLAENETIIISGTRSDISTLAGEHEIKSVTSETFDIVIEGSSQAAVDFNDAGEQQDASGKAAHTVPNTVKLTITNTELPATGTYFVHLSGETGVPSYNGIKLATAIDTSNLFFNDVNADDISSESGTIAIQQLLGVISVKGENNIDEDLKRKWNFAMSFTYDGPGQEVQESLLTQGHKVTPVIRTDNGEANLLTSVIDNSTDPVTVPVDDGTAFSAGDIIMLGTEQLKVGAVSSNNLTGCVRQFNNTAIATHADDTQVFKIEELSPTATVDWTNFTVAPKCVIKSVYNFGTDEKSWNARINGFKIYMKDVTEDDASKEFRLFAEVNLNKGTYTIFAAGDSELILEQPATNAIATVTDGTTLTIKPIDTYLSENLFTEQTIIDAQYKVSEVVGRRAYIGNIRQGGRTYPDRMLRSPVNKFDTFPETNFIDVAVGDGDRITALKSFGDRLLQYKKDTVYIINTSGDSEVLESEYPNAGVAKPSQVVKTNLGIAWFNPSGLWFFDGQQITNLTRNREINSYADHEAQTGIIGFDKYTNRLIYTSQIFAGLQTIWYVYDLELQSYQSHYYGDLFPFSESSSNFYTNMIKDSDGNLILGYVDGADSDKLNFYQWSNNPGAGQGALDLLWKSKDIDFGSPAVNKKIYKIYVTYKSTGHSGVRMKFATDGSNSFTDFSSSKSTNYNVDSFTSAGDATGFQNTYNGSATVWQVAELKPTSSINNIKSIQLSFDAITIENSTAAGGGTTSFGNPSTITLNSSGNSTDENAFVNYNINLDGGPARYNTRKITAYSSGRVATVDTLTDNGYGDSATSATKYILGAVATDFEINDITIVFRPKRVK